MSTVGRTGKAIRNITFNVSNQLLTLILSFLSRWVFIRGFGIGYLGLNGLFTDILSLLSMADLGFNSAMVFSLYKPIAEDNKKEISALIGFYKKIYTIIACVIGFVGLSIIPFLPNLVKLDYEIPNLSIYYILSLSSVVASYLCIYKTAILTADQKGYVITKVAIITNLIKTALQIIMVVAFKNYFLYLLIGTIVTISNNVIASFLSQKEYPCINEKNDISETQKKDIFTNIGSVFLYKISSVLLNATDNIIISTLIGTVFVGLYSNYFIIQSKITSLFSLFFTSLTASIGNLIVTEGQKKRLEVFQCEQSLSYIISGIVCPCYIVLVNDFINLWIGKEYQLNYITTCAIGLNMYLSCVLQPLWSYREATGLYRKTKWVMLICALENIVLSIMMGYKLGVFGVILASAISRITTYIWYEPKILFKEYFEISSKRYFISLFQNTLMIALLVCIFSMIYRYFTVSNWIYLIVKAIFTSVFSAFLMIFLYRKSNGYKIFKEKMQFLLKKKKCS